MSFTPPEPPPPLEPPPPGQEPPVQDPVEQNKQRWQQIQQELAMLSQQAKQTVTANRTAMLDAHYAAVRSYIKGSYV